MALTVGEIHRGGLSIHLRGPSPLIIGQSDGQLWAALGLEGGGKAAGPNIVGAGAPVGQADGELPPLRRGRFKGSVAAVAEGVDAGARAAVSASVIIPSGVKALFPVPFMSPSWAQAST